MSLPYALCALLVWPLYCAADGASSKGGEAGIQVLDEYKYGTKEGLRDRIVNPLTGDGVKMTTLDGQTEFDARISCPSSKEFLKVTALPWGSGGDVRVIVQYDSNTDGTVDQTYDVLYPISGICANSVISCNPGSWEGCRYLMWKVDNNRLALQDVDPLIGIAEQGKPGGCYCINKSCGKTLAWQNTAIVLRDLGGGVAGAFQRVNPRLAISDAKIDGTMIIYYGQDSTGCSRVFTSSGISKLEKYRHAANQMDSDTQAISGQAFATSDPESYYSMLYQTSQLIGDGKTHGDIKTCSVTRKPKLLWSSSWECSTETTIEDTCVAIEEDQTCLLRSEKVDGVDVYYNGNPTGLTPEPSCLKMNDSVSASCDYSCPGVENWDLPCFLETSGGRSCNVGGVVNACTLTLPVRSATGQATPWSHQRWSANGTNVINLGGGQIVFASSVRVYGYERRTGTKEDGVPTNENVVYAYDCRSQELTCNELCTRYPLECNAVGGAEKLSMIWNGINARFFFSGGIGTIPGGMSIDLGQNGSAVSSTGGNLHIRARTDHCDKPGHGAWTDYELPLTFANCPFSGSDVVDCAGSPSVCKKTCSQDICVNWWEKRRTYLCTGDPFDFTDAKRRMTKIKQTTAETGGKASYIDERKGGDRWIQDQGMFDVGPYEQPGVCQKACKTKKEDLDTQAGLGRVPSEGRVVQTTSVFYYYECKNDVCPAKEGETIVKDCQCLNDFAEATAIIQTLRMTSQDLICSDGVAKKLK